MKLEELLNIMSPWVNLQLYGSSERFCIFGAHLFDGCANDLRKNIDWSDWRTLEVKYLEVLNNNTAKIHIDLYESGTEERLADDKFKTGPDIPKEVPSDEKKPMSEYQIIFKKLLENSKIDFNPYGEFFVIRFMRMDGKVVKMTIDRHHEAYRDCEAEMNKGE